MKATELMIGDWIMWKPQKGGFIGIVGGDEAFKPELIKVRARHMDSMLNDYYPIPLTPEILGKNGFEAETFLSSEWDCEVYFREFPGCVVEPDDAGYTFGTISYWGKQANDGSPEDWGTKYESRIKGLHYVHELQHALRLCGLNELADNFQI